MLRDHRPLETGGITLRSISHPTDHLKDISAKVRVDYYFLIVILTEASILDSSRRYDWNCSSSEDDRLFQGSQQHRWCI